MTTEERKSYLKKAYWDRKISGEELLDILEKRLETSYDVTLPKLYVRLLETYSWYYLIDIVPFNQQKDMISENNTSKIWNKPIRKRYDYARRLL